MSSMGVIDDLIEQKLMDLHTAFIGKVVGVGGGKATVQPLNMMKQYGKPAVQQAVVKDVPILKTVYKIELFEFEGTESNHPTHKHGGHVRFIPIQEGDIVFCMCADRDISATQDGAMALPSAGRHEIKDAIIVGVLSTW